MQKEKSSTLVIKRETVLQSIISDTYSFSVLGALFWFNYNLIGGSYFVNFLIILLCIIYIAATIKSDKVMVLRGASDDKINKILKIMEK